MTAFYTLTPQADNVPVDLDLERVVMVKHMPGGTLVLIVAGCEQIRIDNPEQITVVNEFVTGHRLFTVS